MDAASNQHVLYLDGVPVANGTMTHAFAYDSNPWLIGADLAFGNVSDFFQGAIDEVALYDRALGSEEIARIVQAGSIGKCGRETVAPKLRIQPGGFIDTAEISWIPNLEGWHLQEAANPSPNTWNDTPNADTNPHNVNIPYAARFYRLMKP